MSQAFHLIKVVGAVIFILGAAVCLFVALPYALPSAVVGIGFTQIPE